MLLFSIAVLLAPNMTVVIEGDLVQVGFSTTLPDMTVYMEYWSDEDEQNVRCWHTFTNYTCCSIDRNVMYALINAWPLWTSLQAIIHEIRNYPYHFSIATHRGEKMCFRAEALVEAINKSCSIHTQCIRTSEKSESEWSLNKYII